MLHRDTAQTERCSVGWYTYPSLVGFLRRMLGLGEEPSVGAPEPAPCGWVCTTVVTGWVPPNVLPMGLVTKVELSAKTTPRTRHSSEAQLTSFIFLDNDSTQIATMVWISIQLTTLH